MDDGRIGPLLARWHQWRRAYSHERGYARAALLRACRDDEDELEHLTMTAMEAAIATMPADLQLALQHVARAECLGVEVFTTPRLGPDPRGAVQRALSELRRRLLRCGLL